MREFAEQKQLRKRAVLERDAFLQPLLRDSEKLRKEPWLLIAIIPVKIFFERELCEQESHFVFAAAPEIIQCMDADLTDDGSVFGLRRNIRG